MERATYLLACLHDFGTVSQIRWGKPFNLKAIEEVAKPLQHQRSLNYADLAYFTNKDHWWFEQWWAFPPADQVSPALKKAKFEFWQLSKGHEGGPKERETIQQLLKVFKSIELVSIILRFIKPLSFGILSPPVERMLAVPRGSNAVDTYGYYLSALRRIRDAYAGFERVAEVDMALWVLHEKCYSEAPQLRDATVQKQFEQDPFMVQLRAEHMFTALADVSLPDLAQGIRKVQSHLAALVGCHFFELEVRTLAHRHGLLRDTEDVDLRDLINALHSKKKIDDLRKGRWHQLRKIRNAFFHSGVVPRADHIELLIREALEIRRDNTSG